MGATAVGTGLNADPDYIELVDRYLAEYSGFPIKGVSNLVDGTQNTDSYLEVSSALKICMVSMSKIMNDLRMMASGPRCGLGEINLPPRQPGSSIMPGKVNPVMAEVMNQSAFRWWATTSPSRWRARPASSSSTSWSRCSCSTCCSPSPS